MSNLLFCSDLHFHHKNINKLASRPFSSVEEMNEALIKNWNDTVKPKDVIWSLGDFSFGNKDQTIDVLKRLNGHHHMILGNHDKGLVKIQKDLLDQKLICSIQHYKEIIHDGQMIVLFHFPMRTWNKAHHNSILLHGHCHGSISPFGKSVDVGVDSKFINHEYRPLSIEEVLVFMKDRQQEIVDHHGM